MTFQPVIMIGAARSGTKLLRDVISHHPAIDRVPYDINYIWRIGSEGEPNDELSAVSLPAGVKEQIRQEIERFGDGAPLLIEKTVSNCLRVEYVAEIFPDAKFISLVRNGADVVESAHRQWLARPSWRYLLQKARTYPLLRAPGYAFHYATGVARRLMTSEKKAPPVWGPRYRGIDEDLQNYTLLEVCALQWVHCVRSAQLALSKLNSTQVYTVHYEDFVLAPREHLIEIANWLGIESKHFATVDLEHISDVNVGQGQKMLTNEQLAAIIPIIESIQFEQQHV